MLEALRSLDWYWVLAILYWANLLLDYPLQSNFEATNKGKSWYVLWVHSAIWGGGISLVLAATGHLTLWNIPFLVLGHFVVDGWKARGWYKTEYVLGGFTYTFPDGVTKKYEVSKDRKGMTDYQAYMNNTRTS